MSSGRGEAGRSSHPKTSRESSFFFAIVVFIAFVFCIEVALFNNVEIYNETSQILTHLDLWQQTKTTKIGDGHRTKTGDNDQTKRTQIGGNHQTKTTKTEDNDETKTTKTGDNPHVGLPAHLLPKIPILPLFNSIPDAEDHIANLMDGRASMAGVVALLQKCIAELHDKNMEAVKMEADGQVILDNFFQLTEKYIKPFDNAYKGKHIFPLREDGSIFISLAAFREGYLTETLVSAFKNAKNPEKVFVGAVVQNCFGKFREDGTLDTSGKPCRTGKRLVGTDEQGKEIRKVLEVPPDRNDIVAFCAMPEYEKYCNNGQIRVLYMHHTDGQGPSMARYFASKLWGGENYFMQIDSHLRFAHEWDDKFITDAKLTLNYPKSVLSSYPPGFEQVRFIPKHMNIDLSTVNNETVIESPGCRLCHCGTPSAAAGNNPIIHISQSKSYKGDEPRPTQTPFLGAGLVFAHGDLLKVVPYDPYLPWTFMGEEILYGMRAWTNGWNIYAPRKNLVIHQYRPAKLGLPKFYASIQGLFKKFGNNWLQKRTIRRIKHLVGYPFHTAEKIKEDGLGYLLVDIEDYGLGNTRSWDDFMEFSQIKVDYTTGDLVCTKRLDWCVRGTME